MKTDLRYQNGFLYEHHGAWYVRYRQRISKEDGSCNLNHLSKHLGRSKDFRDISDVELRRASFMQTVNRDRLSANSRITLTAFVEGAYLPWTKEERRASTSKGHHEIWINHIRDHVGDLHLREFRTVDASRMLRTIAKENDLTKTTLQHVKSVLSTIFTYAKNEGAFDGATPVDGVLIPRHAKEPGETHAYDLGQVLQIVGLAGETHLERITWRDKVSGETSDHEIRHVFIMAGASPRTEWLTDCLALDNKGFILTGRDLDGTTGTLAWSGARPPYMLETSLPGVFAVGDVRSSNVKRVASAVGEGAISISLVHRSLAEL